MTFFEELMIISRRWQLHIKVIDIKLKKIEDFSLSQNVDLISR